MPRTSRKHTKAVYAGSFDPPTKGHEWVIRRAGGMFDDLVVAVGVNPSKNNTFTVQERVAMLLDLLRKNRNVKVASYNNKLLVNYARSIGAKYIIRGIRDGRDLDYERGMLQINRGIDDSIETVFLIPPPEIAAISSGFVKGLIGPDGGLEAAKRYVSQRVYTKLVERLARPRRPKER